MGLLGRSSFSQRHCLALGSKPMLITAEAVLLGTCCPHLCLPSWMEYAFLILALGFPGRIAVVGLPGFYAQGISNHPKNEAQGTVAAQSVGVSSAPLSYGAVSPKIKS